jgi:hypothetical protein
MMPNFNHKKYLSNKKYLFSLDKKKKNVQGSSVLAKESFLVSKCFWDFALIDEMLELYVQEDERLRAILGEWSSRAATYPLCL